ncbi:hypothetical protein GALMADRAFT_877956 [Galerina marginata CBS 339.88]|uniref:MYND-type domain-containing protein n=1 Tax=Galerina marginata (strain CBS 339.88) TaxID=685588 RepID=A0A067SKK6_GALM3|nr:hypothetical protein GALMADRAFT_877956 [Galerina marginata CBS 339.88]
MSAFGPLSVNGKPIPGVYNALNFATFKKHSRSLSERLLACATCAQESKQIKNGGVDLKLCRGCLYVAFCSKECQIALWPSHKKECRPNLPGSINLEVAEDFLSNPFLLHYLRVALIAKLAIGLGRVDLDPQHEEGLILGTIDPNGSDRIPGFLRLEIHDDPLEPILFDTNGKGGLTKQRESDSMLIRLWRLSRKYANSIGHNRYPIVMVGFGYENVRHDYGIEITPEALATALGGQSASPIATLPASIKPPPFPWTYDAVMFGIILEYIKLDTDNTLKLRRHLGKTDKLHIRRIGLEYFGMTGPKKLLGSGWSLTGSEMDSPDETRKLAEAF